MVSMKIYDRTGGRNFIEIFPHNSEHLVNILYGKNKMRVSMNLQEVKKLISFLQYEADRMPIMLPARPDANTNVL